MNPSSTDPVKPQPLPVVIVTGMSGAGKTHVLKFLEDGGYSALDNIPLALCHDLCTDPQRRKPLALGMDIRTLNFDPANILRHVAVWRQSVRVTVLFMDAVDSVLLQRYRETRRLHPLGAEKDLALLIPQERCIIRPLLQDADAVIDTSCLTPPELKHRLWTSVTEYVGKPHLSILSFAYRRGIPTAADNVMDVRFLPNPFYKASLKNQSGQSPDISAFLRDQPSFQSFWTVFTQLADLWLQEKRPSFLWAFGCTGGKHRSVFTAVTTGEWLMSRGYAVTVHHRDLA
jgi:UPF0042 nucleotide-binding protein